MSNPIRPTFDQELHSLQDNLLRLGSMLESALSRATQALATRDIPLAHQVIADDEKINALRYEIEEACFTALATQQPAARDLRAVMATFSMATDLERMADHAAGIATIVVRMGDEPLLKPLIDIPRMADTCRDMFRQALDAYVLHDEAKARSVAECDDVIDDLYQQVFRELLSYMLEDPRTISRALYLLFIAHNLERIGDRAVNLSHRFPPGIWGWQILRQEGIQIWARISAKSAKSPLEYLPISRPKMAPREISVSERVVFITSGELKEFKSSAA